MLVLSVRGMNQIPLDRAESSSTAGSSGANKAIDNNLNTEARTSGGTDQGNSWLRLYFTSASDVGKVVIEKAESKASVCVYTVSVYHGKTKTLCGTYKTSGVYNDKIVQCGGVRGDSVILEMTVCVRDHLIYEIAVYGTGRQ